VFADKVSPEPDPGKEKSMLLFDVVQAPFGGTTTYVLHGQRLVKQNELALRQREYTSFDIEFYAPGTGVYEYRVRVFEDNMAGEEIKFDKISVFRNPQLWEVV
jgi:hypothetical protein